MANRDFEWFFFTSTTRKHPGASETSRASRRAGLGRWKATKGVRTALDSKNNTIGSKQSFCYMEQNPKGGEEKTVWLMEEFSARNLRRRGSADVMRDTNKVHITLINGQLMFLLLYLFLIVGIDVLTLHLWSFTAAGWLGHLQDLLDSKSSQGLCWNKTSGWCYIGACSKKKKDGGAVLFSPSWSSSTFRLCFVSFADSHSSDTTQHAWKIHKHN